MAKYMIDMPEQWDAGRCIICPFTIICGNEDAVCHLSQAVKAVEVKYGDRRSVAQDGMYVMNGKPVKLWATEEE